MGDGVNADQRMMFLGAWTSLAFEALAKEAVRAEL